MIKEKIQNIKEYIDIFKNLQVTREYPLSLVHFVTKRCNARCSFCFIDFNNPETFKNELKLHEIEKITKSSGPLLQNVNITGGEPFARKDIIDICRLWFKNSTIRSMYITTNGSLPDRIINLAKQLSTEFPDKKIFFSISIDEFPEKHDEIRKIKGLFNSAIESYNGLAFLNENVFPNIGITVSPENYKKVISLYNFLKNEKQIKSITNTIVRDEGVFKIPSELKSEIHRSYCKLNKLLHKDIREKRMGFDTKSLQGRLMNTKNNISNRIIEETYLEPTFLTPCRSASLFGIIDSNGDVFPCEILENKLLGSLKNFDFNLLKLWHDNQTEEIKNWIVKSKCNCTYECALSFNIVGNKKYNAEMLKGSIFGN